jgi:flavin-dependent dehydrogenase
MDRDDVVIIGAGIGGAALAGALAADGLSVLALEQSEVYEDRVRGESMQPWGVAEARTLGLEKTLLDAGAHISKSWFVYHLPDMRDEIPIGAIVPGVDGSLNPRHPDACQALADTAVALGAAVRRGTREVSFDLGPAPTPPPRTSTPTSCSRSSAPPERAA